MAFRVVNTSVAPVQWGIVTIDNITPFTLDNTGLTKGDYDLTFEQFSENTQYALDGTLIVQDGITPVVDTQVWIEDYYNNSLIAYDQFAGSGDMLKSEYSTNGEYGTVDSSMSTVVKTSNIAGTPYRLTSLDTSIEPDKIIGVNKGNGIAVVDGVVDLLVYNRIGADAILTKGLFVYRDTSNGDSGQVKISTNVGGLRDTEEAIYVGTIAEDTSLIPSNDSAVVKILVSVDKYKDTVENPDSDGLWVRKRDGINYSWSEELDGGTY